MISKKWMNKNIWIWSVFGSIVLWIIISFMTKSFSLEMLLANATLASFLVILCLGQMTVMTSGNGAIDLSIQYTVALAAYVSSILMVSLGIPLGILVTLLICAGVGALNGLINMYLKVPAMITTLAVGYIVFSGVLVISGITTGAPGEEFAYFVQKFRIAGISPLIFIAAACAILMAFILYKTKYGKRLHAVGQNRQAAQFAGINIVRVVMTTFTISSVLAGVAGILLGGYFGGAFQDMGLSYLMTSVAAAVIGGTSAAGGKSSVAGAVSGAMLLTLIVALLNLSQLHASYQNLIQGALLMVLLIASVPKGKRAFS